MTGNRRRNQIEPIAKRERGAEFGQLPRQIGEQPRHIGRAQRRRGRADQHRRRPEPLDLQAQLGQFACRVLQPVAFDLVKLDRLGDQQRLSRNRAAGIGLAHSLEHEPLMRGMLVDDHQTILGFSDDIGRRHLPSRDTEGI